MLKSFGKKLISFFTTKPKMTKFLKITLGVFVLVGVLAVASPAKAQLFSIAIDSIAEGISNVLLWLASLIGKLLVVVIDIMIDVTQYNDFANAAAVIKGWVVVRDVSNMFFVMVLLVIAFGTILKIENYKYNRLLAKLVIMAVLINFSKTIAGFFIDMSQVVMMTFVNAYADTAAANFTSILKLKNMLGLLPSGNDAAAQLGQVTNADLIAVPAMAIIMLIIALMVMLAILVVFLVRIIALWILVVLSPLAYILSVLPLGQKYSSQWWSTFGKWLTTGPILAFFLWLSLAVLSTSTDNLGISVESGSVLNVGGNNLAASLSSVSSAENMLGFMLSVAMLMIALSVAGTLGGVAGAVAGKMSGRIKSLGSAPLRLAGKITRAPLQAGAYGVKSAGRWAAKKFIYEPSKHDVEQGKMPWRRMVTPEFWKGFAQKGGKEFDEAKRETVGTGEFVAEVMWKGKDAAIRREEMVQASIIQERISSDSKELGPRASRQDISDQALRRFMDKGKQGEIGRAASVQKSSGSGNIDDIFEDFSVMYKKEGTEKSNKIKQKFMDTGYNEEEVKKIFEKKNADSMKRFMVAYVGLDRKYIDDPNGEELSLKSGAEDQYRLRALASASQAAKEAGHHEQNIAIKDPETGRTLLMEENHRQREVLGEIGKMDARQYYRTVAVHVTRQSVIAPVLDDDDN
ncbi:hypothetical protein IID19_05770, partial [Patescibacteria group bacterium]|nr:hypothetical protein [Patescibacteria group bacterium]